MPVKLFIASDTATANAFTALFYATFWLEKLTHPTQPSFMRLQYAQMTMLKFSGTFTRQADCQPASSTAEFRLAACSSCNFAKDIRRCRHWNFRKITLLGSV